MTSLMFPNYPRIEEDSQRRVTTFKMGKDDWMWNFPSTKCFMQNTHKGSRVIIYISVLGRGYDSIYLSPARLCKQHIYKKEYDIIILEQS